NGTSLTPPPFPPDGSQSSKDLRICQVRPACIISGNNPEIATGFPLQRMVEMLDEICCKAPKAARIYQSLGLCRLTENLLRVPQTVRLAGPRRYYLEQGAPGW